MATIQHFEELEVWQRARTLTKEIYAISEKTFSYLNESMVETGRMIGGLMNYLRKSGIKGNKFNQQ